MRARWTLPCLALAAACVSSHTQPAPAPLGGLRANEAVTVLLHHYEEGEGEATGAVSSAEAAEIEARLGQCVSDALGECAPGARVIATAEFAREVFPNVPPERVPRSPESLLDLASNPEFRARAAALGLRYLVIATGATQMPHTGGIACFGGYGGAACLGLVIWHRDSQLAAVVLDLASEQLLQGPEAEASGHAWFAALGIFPLGMPPGFTRARACSGFGRAVAEALATGAPPAP
jgi:hypothetical protein